ncbi:hypothetical protein VNI00_019348, partial [Paramarasmius palmivorus]
LENSDTKVNLKGNVPGTTRPACDESLEKLLTVVGTYDEELVKGWREDIDTLLVFAGLFSAVVTAFLIESYQQLEEDPADKTNTLLEQLIYVQLNASHCCAPQVVKFTPNASTIRVNCFWFLSLVFSLTAALFGLLCKQWIREHQRDPFTQSPEEALALRQLRRDSLEKWKVFAFLSALPILLEVALILFFMGILDLLWNLHPIPFIISLVAIVLSVGLYFTTTLLPTLAVPKDQRWNIKCGHFERLSFQFICPYKSPQAWIFYRLVCKVFHLIVRLFPSLSTDNLEENFDMPAPALLYHIESPAKDWASFDLRVIRQYDQYTRHWGGDAAKLSVYQLRAFEWMVTSFRDSPMMIPHLQDILKTIPSSIALSAVLGQWNVTLWEDVSTSDVDIALKNPTSVHRDLRLAGDAPPPAIPYPVIHHQEGIRLLFHHRYWMALADSYRFRYLPDNEIERGQWSTPWQTTDLHFLIPFPAVEALWSHESVAVRKRSLILLRSLEESWNSCSSCKDDDSQRHQRELCAFVSALARHINRKDCVSQLLTSKRGQAFIKFIHNEVINQRLHHEFSATTHRDWPKAVKRAQEVGRLPDDHFTTPPDWGESTPNLSVPPSVRYSVDTSTNRCLGGEKGFQLRVENPSRTPIITVC